MVRSGFELLWIAECSSKAKGSFPPLNSFLRMKDTLLGAMAASRDAAGHAAAFNAESPADIAIQLLDLLVTGSEVCRSWQGGCALPPAYGVVTAGSEVHGSWHSSPFLLTAPPFPPNSPLPSQI